LAREPFYLVVANQLGKRILNGEIGPGEKLPTEAELCAEYDVSRATVREALGQLESRGLITRRHGIGSFVVGSVDDEVVAGLERMESLTETIRRMGHEASDRVAAIEKVKLDGTLAERLKVPVGSLGYLIKSIRTSNGVPVNFSRDALRGDVVTDEAVLQARSRYESLLEFLEAELGIKVNYSLMYLEAVEAQGEAAKMLELPTGYPVVHLQGLVRDRNGQGIYYSSNYFRSDKYKFMLVRRA